MKNLLYLILGLFTLACTNSTEKSQPKSILTKKWTPEKLKEHAQNQVDSTLWDKTLFAQDIETYQNFKSIFEAYPLNKSPFPVTNYDYSVASTPIEIDTNGRFFKGISIGDFEHIDADTINYKLSLILVHNSPEIDENTLVDSRNYPYLTAQGIFTLKNTTYDWVFNSSPDGFSTLMINMKLFDLRFGETILIFPQENLSFTYQQLTLSPNDFDQMNDYKNAIIKAVISSSPTEKEAAN
ncbi:hypothetical protein [Crocinitomix algicola]|uniref:hypothetical protein n=1 Tax=Crocinitomix algicola TaxID=1740263 RepID=UPI000834542A|nr:hypothetical protein [Crocinitomix algicola]